MSTASLPRQVTAAFDDAQLGLIQEPFLRLALDFFT